MYMYIDQTHIHILQYWIVEHILSGRYIFHFLFSSVNIDSLLTRCIHLLAELSQQKSMADKVSSLLPAVAETVRHRHYCQHLSLLETLLRRLPHIARGLGKRLFKRHLVLFLDHMFYGTVSYYTVYMSSTQKL